MRIVIFQYYRYKVPVQNNVSIILGACNKVEQRYLLHFFVVPKYSLYSDRDAHQPIVVNMIIVIVRGIFYFNIVVLFC